MIYLDTHIVVWLYSGRIELLSKNAQQMIEDNQLLISPMTLLELDLLYEIKRIQINAKKIQLYLEQQIGLSVCDKKFERICENAATLTWTRDPFDRIITAQAAITKSVLLTKDTTIRRNYAHAMW